MTEIRLCRFALCPFDFPPPPATVSTFRLILIATRDQASCTASRTFYRNFSERIYSRRLLFVLFFFLLLLLLFIICFSTRLSKRPTARGLSSSCVRPILIKAVLRYNIIYYYNCSTRTDDVFQKYVRVE